jgi:hypothetical protein
MRPSPVALPLPCLLLLTLALAACGSDPAGVGIGVGTDDIGGGAGSDGGDGGQGGGPDDGGDVADPPGGDTDTARPDDSGAEDDADPGPDDTTPGDTLPVETEPAPDADADPATDVRPPPPPPPDVGTGPGPDSALPTDIGSDPPDADPLCRDGLLCGPARLCCRGAQECLSDRCVEACESGVRCGAAREACCATGDVCLEDRCVTPSAGCLDSLDCDAGEFCEPTLGACLPQPPVVTCEVVPSFSTIEVREDWAYVDDEVISVPVVADVTGDGITNVVVNAARIGGDWPLGEVVLLNGRTGERLWRIAHDPPNNRWGSHGRSTVAVGDVSGDGIPDIVYASRPSPNQSRIVAVDGFGNTLWASRLPNGNPASLRVENGAITLANFDDDPMAEVVIGGSLFDHDGTMLWNEGNDGGVLGSNAGYLGGISVVADLDLDGVPEIISGNAAWKVTWNAGPPASATVTRMWLSTQPDGKPAVADMDGDGWPEVILVGGRQVSILDGRTGELWCALASCTTAERVQPVFIPGETTNNRGGPPTVADFDGDGRPEIGVAGGQNYVVFDLNRPGEDTSVRVGAAPAQGQLYVRWQQATRDRSSNATGSAVFDFQGDGAAEVIYADECFMRAYDGATGAVQLEIANSTGTIHEYPVVVDVDDDGRSEVLIVANVTGASSNCAGIPGYTGRRGVYAYGDPANAWVRTRRVWTQHAYHVTNATSSGNVPLRETPHWTLPGLNSYRQNVQGEGVFNAPDLTVTLTFDVRFCAASVIEITARVRNVGALGVPAGVPVAFYEGASPSGTPFRTFSTSGPLLPGAEERFSITVPLDPENPGVWSVRVDGRDLADAVPECDEDNNTAVLSLEACRRGT